MAETPGDETVRYMVVTGGCERVLAAPELASRITEEAAKRGLLLLKAGVFSNCIRVLCPLVITDPELDEALGAWDEALEAVLA